MEVIIGASIGIAGAVDPSFKNRKSHCKQKNNPHQTRYENLGRYKSKL